MPKKYKPIQCRMFIPDGSGGYREYSELSESEREEFSSKIVDRLGHGFNDYFSRNQETYAKFCNKE